MKVYKVVSRVRGDEWDEVLFGDLESAEFKKNEILGHLTVSERKKSVVDVVEYPSLADFLDDYCSSLLDMEDVVSIFKNLGF